MEKTELKEIKLLIELPRTGYGKTMFFNRFRVEAATEWTKWMEKEFRRLALAEAKGTLTEEQTNCLNALTHSRNCLLCPPSEDEMLRRIKRDRLLEKLSEALREYVEFEEGASQKRATA